MLVLDDQALRGSCPHPTCSPDERWKYDVSPVMLSENRQKLVSRLRDVVKEQRLPQGIVVLQGGESTYQGSSDTQHLFLQESYFSYLFGVNEPGLYGAVDISTGHSFLFIPRLPASYAVWMGPIKPPSFYQNKYQVDSAHYSDEVSSVLCSFFSSSHSSHSSPSACVSHSCRPTLYLLSGVSSDSGNVMKAASFDGISSFATDLTTLSPVLSECRVIKSAKELSVLRYVTAVSSAAHVHVMQCTTPGLKEYQLESSFLHFCYSRGGCRNVAYISICATGENSAILHYGHAGAPNDRTLVDGDMALFDMGAKYAGYCSDITCSFPVNGVFSPDQRMVYQAVLSAQQAVFSRMKPGVKWLDMHNLSQRIILEHLTAAGVLQGSVDAMVSSGLGYVFMPHGLGHFVGQDVHDVGGYPKGMCGCLDMGLGGLRTTRELMEGMVITIEPGCYFNDSLLLPAMDNPDTSHFFVKTRIEALRGSGGVRIEDDVIVTATGAENMTLCPREIEDVERVCAGERWLPCDRFLAQFRDDNDQEQQ